MKSEFKRFQQTFTAYQEKFGLNGYRVYFKEAALSNCMANILVNQDGAVVNVSLNNITSPDENINKDIPLSAKHEAIHLLLARFADTAESRYVSQEEVNRAEEELVRRLEKLIPDIKVIK